MTYILVVVLGIDYNLVNVSVMNGLCQPPIWIGVIAFTLIYGVVLAKTFKVYFIIKNLQVTRPDKKRVSYHDDIIIILILCMHFNYVVCDYATIHLITIRAVLCRSFKTGICSCSLEYCWELILFF